MSLLCHGISQARAGRGGYLFIEGFAGTGKSALLAETRRLAEMAGARVLSAHGRILETDHPFGVTTQLFERDLQETLPDLESSTSSPTVIRGLFRQVVGLANRHAPIVLTVDDLQWSDEETLRFLTFLLHRACQLSIFVVTATREGERTRVAQTLSEMRRVASGAVLHTCPLTLVGVSQLVRRRLPQADEPLCLDCLHATAGNPFMLVELLKHLNHGQRAEEAVRADQPGSVAPERVVQWLAARLDALQPDARRLAKVLAVLGDHSSIREAARLANLDEQRAVAAADDLAAVELLRPGAPLRFVAPIVAAAVLKLLPPLQHQAARRRAATILADEGADPARIIPHVLAGLPGDSPAVIAALRTEAVKLNDAGCTLRAVELLERALAEDAADEVRVETLAELGPARAKAALPNANEALAEARRLTEEPRRRAELALTEGRMLHSCERFVEATAVLEAGISDAPPRSRLLLDLLAAFVSAASEPNPPEASMMRRREQLLSLLPQDPEPHLRVAIAHSLVHDGLRGATRGRVVELADLAWGDGVLANLEGHHRCWPPLVAALLYADELGAASGVAETLLGTAQAKSNATTAGALSCLRGWAQYEQGQIYRACEDADRALSAPPDQDGYLRSALALKAAVELESMRLGPAMTLLERLERQHGENLVLGSLVLDLRARVRLERHEAGEALEDALRAGDLLDVQPTTTSPGVVAWRSTAALARLAQGQAERGAELASEELESARALGLDRVIIRATRVLGLAEGGANGIDLLREAVDLGERSSPRLEYTRALVDLGAALRRAKRRSEARAPLLKALDLGYRGGSTAVSAQARVELGAAGARPRRAATTGPEALTVSERRVANLAARDMTNRQIAETLFVSPKTVEFHLRHVYRKLGVSSRDRLAQRLKTFSSSKTS